MKTNMIKRINSIMQQLPEAEKKVAECIVTYPDEIIGMTTIQLAQKANSSSAAVIRLCKRIDVNSFTTLKVNIAAELKHQQPTEYYDIAANESISDLKIKLLSNAVQSINDTLQQVNDDKLNEIVDIMIESKVIIVFGIGASSLVAQNLMQKLSRIGKNIVCLEDIHILIPLLATLEDQGLLIVFSNSGNTNEVIDLVELARSINIKTVGISQFGKGRLKEVCEYSLFTTISNEKINRSAATSSLHAQFILVDLIFSLYFTKHYKKNTKKIDDSRRLIESYRK